MKIEYLFLVLLHAFENLLLISPAIYTYTNVKRRHQFLEDTIGATELETEAMIKWEYIVTIAPTIVILSIPIQLLLLWAFNMYGHPWKRFLTEFAKKPKKISIIEAIARSYSYS